MLCKQAYASGLCEPDGINVCSSFVCFIVVIFSSKLNYVIHCDVDMVYL